MVEFVLHFSHFFMSNQLWFCFFFFILFLAKLSNKMQVAQLTPKLSLPDVDWFAGGVNQLIT